MVMAQPHFLLFCDTHLAQPSTYADSATPRRLGVGRWHFVLERLDGPERLEVADSETQVNGDRLALLSVVRGLEALEGPSQVTLVTTSRYVSRGLRYGLNTWRESDYTWERFGVQKPIRNADLWQRIDRAMEYHAIICRLIQSNVQAQSQTGPPVQGAAPAAGEVVVLGGDASQADPRNSLPAQQAAARCYESDTTRPALGTMAGQGRGADAVPPREAERGRQISTLRNVTKNQDPWWQMAAPWIKWARGRMQPRPVFYGT